MSENDFVPFPDNYFNNDSSYYGDEEVQKIFEDDLSAFNPLEFWRVHDHNYRCLRIQATADPAPALRRKRSLGDDDEDGCDTKRMKAEVKGDQELTEEKEVDLRVSKGDKPGLTQSHFDNYYEKAHSGKKTNETIDDFLKRMRPSTTTSWQAQGAWIWCANPHQKREEQDSDEFTERGLQLLEDFSARRLRLEEENSEKPPQTITRLLTGPRKYLEHQITELATRYNVLSGKWMLFPTRDNVDSVWHTVAQATWDGTLGSAAKVATCDSQDEGKQDQLICIYTRDFRDLEDVRYVLKEMKRLGLVQDHGGAKVCYYKCDAYTHLGLLSGNEYKIRASLYNSKNMFKEMGMAGSGGKRRK